MPIKIHCQYCHKSIKAPDEAAGKRGKCPFCGQSNYIPNPVSEDELIPLASVDEQEEKELERRREELLKEEMKVRETEGGTDEIGGLENRQDLSSEDLHRYVAKYVSAMYNSKFDEAEAEVQRLKKFRYTGLQAVEDFLTGKASDPAMKNVPDKLREGFLKELSGKLR